MAAGAALSFPPGAVSTEALSRARLESVLGGSTCAVDASGSAGFSATVVGGSSGAARGSVEVSWHGGSPEAVAAGATSPAADLRNRIKGIMVLSCYRMDEGQEHLLALGAVCHFGYPHQGRRLLCLSQRARAGFAWSGHGCCAGRRRTRGRELSARHLGRFCRLFSW